MLQFSTLPDVVSRGGFPIAERQAFRLSSRTNLFFSFFVDFFILNFYLALRVLVLLTLLLILLIFP